MSSSLHKVFSSSLDEINNGLRKEFVTYDIFREISSFKNEKFKKGIILKFKIRRLYRAVLHVRTYVTASIK